MREPNEVRIVTLKILIFQNRRIGNLKTWIFDKIMKNNSKMKLATFEVIDRIDVIECTDSIVIAVVKGFEIVVKRDLFKVGDVCVYIPPDTCIDKTKKWFSTYKDNRVRTTKICDVYSQGILLTLSQLEGVVPDHTTVTDEEFDLGPLIGVTKYTKDSIPHNIKNQPLPEFPSHLIPITDEVNLKSIKGKYKDILFLNELDAKSINVTLKMDGTSMTMIWQTCGDKTIFTMASRNFSLHRDIIDSNGIVVNEFSYPDDKTTFIKANDLARRFIGRNIAIQGELCGPKIGGNKLGFSDLELFIFTVRDLDTNLYYSYDEIVELCSSNSLHPVPLLHRLTVTQDTNLKYFQDLADEVKYLHFKTGTMIEGEGIVVRPDNPFKSKGVGGKNCSFKLINRKYKD